MDESSEKAKYSSPKILLVDTSPDIEKMLARHGFDTASGSFGNVLSGQTKPVPAMTNGNMPFDWADRWLTIVELLPQSPGEEQESRPIPANSFLQAVPDQNGIINPRPYAMRLFRSGFDRIIANGGIFVCFAGPKKDANLLKGRSGYSQEGINVPDWDFTKWLSPAQLTVDDATGHDMVLCEEIKGTPYGRLLEKYVDSSSFFSVFAPAKKIYSSEIDFSPLLNNKFGRAVAAILRPREGATGIIMILPQLARKADFLTQLVTEILPDMAPNLFPDLVSGRWVTDSEYEIPEVLKLTNDIKVIQQKLRNKVNEIETEIKHTREKWGYLHDLLRGTGDVLVDAVEKTLNLLGFAHTTNVDKEIAAGRETIPRREDLRIKVEDRPELVVEVRGISNLPSDEDCMGAEKHVHPRAKERGDLKVKGLTIINHERNLPPMQRQNDKVFRDDVVTNAREREIGLLTTWNLYRLARSYLKYDWQHDQIEYLFYQSGPIIPVPRHYTMLGTIGRVFTREAGTIIGIELTNGEIQRGDQISVELDNEFGERVASSLGIGGQNVDKACVGDQVGVLTDLSRDQLRKGMRVFKVLRPSVTSE